MTKTEIKIKKPLVHSSDVSFYQKPGVKSLNGRRVEAVLSQRLLEPQKESMAGRGRRAFLETKQRAVKANLRSGIISEGQLETKNDVHSQQ